MWNRLIEDCSALPRSEGDGAFDGIFDVGEKGVNPCIPHYGYISVESLLDPRLNRRF